MRVFPYLILAMILISGSCEKKFPTDGVSTDSKKAVALEKVPETAMVEGKTLVLSSELWRDFMPGVGEMERSLRAAVSISTNDGANLPSGLNFQKLAVINGDSIWMQSITNSDRSDGIRLKANTKGGPEWKPDSKVDVVVEFLHNNKSYKLRQKSVEIRATY